MYVHCEDTYANSMQISKYATASECESVSLTTEAGMSGVSSGGRSGGGAVIMESRTISKEIKLTEKIGEYWLQFLSFLNSKSR